MNPTPRLSGIAVLLSIIPAVVAAEEFDTRADPLSVREFGVISALHPVQRTEVDLAGVFGGESLQWGSNRFAVPLRQEMWRLDSQRSLLTNALAIEWQHSMNSANHLMLSARYRDTLTNDPELAGSAGTTATLSWSSLLGGESRVSGRFYVGDEDAQPHVSSERRYVGMHLEGSYALWRDHRPFATLLWQRNQYETVDNSGLTGSLLRHDSFSRLAAGWNWQVSPGWDMRAEANYRLSDDGVDAADYDRTQLYFSTRYGFR